MKFTKFCDTLHPADQEAMDWLLKSAEGAQLNAKAIGQVRSVDQNALYQVWTRDYAAHFFNIARTKVTEAQHEAMKYTLQRHCYAATGWSFLLLKLDDLFGGGSKPQRAQTSKLPKGEMHSFLSWVQMRAADDGLMLESIGEYQELQQGQVA